MKLLPVIVFKYTYTLQYVMNNIAKFVSCDFRTYCTVALPQRFEPATFYPSLPRCRNIRVWNNSTYVFFMSVA